MNISLTHPHTTLSPPNPKCLINPQQSQNHKPYRSIKPLSYRISKLVRLRTVVVRTVGASGGGGYGDDREEVVVREMGFVEFVESERFRVVAMIAVALVLCNADRVVMSVAIVPLSLANGWSQSFAGVVQSSFLWGYLISPIAGGTLVDYYGGKVVLACGVGLWSLATFLTPKAANTSLWALLGMRVLVGVAEGVALPCMNNMILRWFPITERSRAVGLAIAGFQLGNAIELVFSPILMSWFGVFGPFMMFGSLGFFWVLLWVLNISSTPYISNRISRYELEYIRSNSTNSMISNDLKKAKLIPPFRRLLSKMPTWSLIVANMMQSWGYFLFLSWMPIYFKTIYNVELRQAAWFSAVPWSIMALMCYFAGAASDKLIKRGLSITLTRKIMQSVGFVGPAISLVGLTLAKSPSTASAWLSLAVGLSLSEIAPQYSGVLHGMSNTAGSFAAIVGTIGAGYFVELVGSFQGFLLITSFLYICATIFWNIFSTGERVNFDKTE